MSMRSFWLSAVGFVLAACGCRAMVRTEIGGDLPERSGKPLNSLDVLVLDDGSADAKLPEGWEAHQFEEIPRSTEFRIERDADGRQVLRATSVDAASALRRKLDLDPATHPIIAWRWKTNGPIDGADVSRKETDDCVARVMILYRYHPENASWLERMKFNAARSEHGEYPPGAMLVYAWTQTLSKGTAISHPGSDRIRVVAVEQGAAGAGRWSEVRRNHLEDFRKLFGRDPPPIEGVSLMVDTDDTHSRAVAWWRDLWFEPAE